jgi:hypothetical protein
MGTDTLEKLRSAAMDELDAFAAREPERALELKVRSVNAARVECEGEWKNVSPCACETE